jgi:putative flippase GtrA
MKDNAFNERFRGVIMELSLFLKRLLKYAGSSALAVGTDFALLLLFVQIFNWELLEAAVVSFAIGHSLNYLISRHWNFNLGRKERAHHYLLFVGFGILSMFAMLGILSYLVSEGVYYITARVIAGVVIGFLNFLFNYYITFKAHLEESK